MFKSTELLKLNHPKQHHMKFVVAFLILLPAFVSAQYRITVILDKVPDKPTPDRIYIAGNFNEWNPADPEAALSKNDKGKFTKVFEGVDAGTYEFKFTLGTTESMECKLDGTELPSRTLVLQSDTTIHLTVARWKSAKNLDDSEKNGNRLPQLTSVTFVKPRIDLYNQRLKTL